MARKRANGEGTIRKRLITRTDGTSYVRWFARVTIGWDGAKKTTKDGPLRKTQNEARADLTDLQRRQKLGQLSHATDQSVETYLANWLEQASRKLKFRSYQTYDQDLRNHVIPRLGHIRLNKLKKTDVQNMIHQIHEDMLASGRDGRAVVRKARAALRTALQDAIDLDILDSNPCIGVKVPAEVTSDLEVWTVDEAKCFLRVVRPHRLHALFYTAITTGLREGELLALKWEDLELTAKQPLLHVRRTLVRVPKHMQHLAEQRPDMKHVTGLFYFDRPKTKKSMNAVTLPADTVTALEAHRAAQEEQKARCQDRYSDLGLVFPTRYGTPLSFNTVLDAHYALIEEAGVPVITFHNLRHTHATRLLVAGVDIATVSDRLRHSTQATTLNRYSRVVESQRRKAAATIEEMFKDE